MVIYYYEGLKNIFKLEDSLELKAISNQLSNSDTEKVIPFNERETYILRRILNARYKFEKVNGKSLNITTNGEMIKLKKILLAAIDYLKDKKERLSVFDYIKDRNKDKEIPITDIFDENISTILRMKKIFTLNDLLSINRTTLKGISYIGKNIYKEIVNKIHNEYNLFFIDEIPVEERINFLNEEYSKNKQKVSNSYYDWLDFNLSRQKRLRTINIYTIKDVAEKREIIANNNETNLMLKNFKVIDKISNEIFIVPEKDDTERSRQELIKEYNILIEEKNYLANKGIYNNKEKIERINERIKKLFDMLSLLEQSNKGKKR